MVLGGQVDSGVADSLDRLKQSVESSWAARASSDS
jgi:hypothetical protein